MKTIVDTMMQKSRLSPGKMAVLSGFISVVLAGCQTPPDIKKLQDENGSLQQQLVQANGEIDKLQANSILLEQNAAELSRVISVLGQEKTSRVEESTSLRGQVRHFVQQQIDSFKQFLLAADLLDYVGGELVERGEFDEEPVLLVDLKNPVPLNGSLTGVGGYYTSVGTVSVKVLRPVADDMVVVWSSQPITVSERGQQRLKFPVVVGVEQGDILAYYLSKPGMVGFDTGTGDSRYIDKDVVVGSSLRRSSLNGEKAKRAYSIGVFGLLNVK